MLVAIWDTHVNNTEKAVCGSPSHSPTKKVTSNTKFTDANAAESSVLEPGILTGLPNHGMQSCSPIILLGISNLTVLDQPPIRVRYAFSRSWEYFNFVGEKILMFPRWDKLAPRGAAISVRGQGLLKPGTRNRCTLSGHSVSAGDVGQNYISVLHTSHPHILSQSNHHNSTLLITSAWLRGFSHHSI